MNNPISYNDLFDAGLIGQIGELSTAIKGVLGELTQAKEGMKSSAESIKKQMEATSVATDQGRQSMRKMVADTEQLVRSYASLTAQEQEVIDAARQYATAESDLNKIAKLQVSMAKEQETSYNRIASTYKLVKIALNAMTDAEIKNTEVGRNMLQLSADLYEQMNQFQMSTGKFQLNVGHYEKAMNGLGLATQQVVREMPTLANSFSQFIIAISNNIPILLDNFKRVRMETGSFATAMKGVITSLFSWQTALLVVLTVLPRIARNIAKQRKEQEEANKAMEDAVDLLKILAQAEKDVFAAGTQASNKAQVMYEISQDVTRSYEDRIDAARVLKQEMKEELANYTEEQIVVGGANAVLEQYITTLYKQAEVRAYLGEIEKNIIKLYDLEQKQNAASAEVDKAVTDLKIANQNRLLAQQRIVGESQAAYDARQIAAVAAYNKARTGFEKARENYNKIAEGIADVNEAIEELKRRIDPQYLLENDKNGGRIKSYMNSIKDYYNEALGSIISRMEEGSTKQLMILTLNHKKQLEQYNAYRESLLEITRKGNAQEIAEARKQISNLDVLIASAREKFEQDRAQLVQSIVSSWQEAVDEEDTDAQIMQSLQTRLKLEQDTRDAAIYRAYETRQEYNGKILDSEKAVNEALLASQKQYWRDYLKNLRENGLITEQLYNQIMANLIKADEKATSETQKKRRSHRYRGVFDILFGQTTQLGEKDQNGGWLGNVKEEYRDYADAMNNALSSSIKYMQEWMSARMEMAQIAIDAAKKEVEATKKALDYEMEARANGYANNVDLARKEYEESLALQRKAEEEARRLQEINDRIETANQVMSLASATANIWKGATAVSGPFGIPLATAATLTMLGSFAYAKIEAAKAAKLKTYGEGMSEYLDYGGSHASGNDIDFGVMKDGTRRRVERGEMIGVINKRNVQKYGVNTLTDIISSLNRGDFEQKYGLAFAGLGLGGADLSEVEKGISTLVSQGERRTVVTPYGRIEYNGHNKRIIRN